MGSIFAAGVFGVGIKELASMADSMQQLRDRIGLLSGGAGEVSMVMEELAQRANTTRTTLSDLATTYVRLGNSTKETGIDTRTLLDLTESLQKTFLLSGSTAQEAAAASVQLSQGLASGALRGEEFNSVMEQNVVMGDLLSKELGKTRGELRAMAKEGRITNKEVMGALLKNFDALGKQSEKLRITIGQGVSIAMNNFLVTLDKVNEKLNLSSGIGKGIIALGDNLGYIATVLGTLSLSLLPAFIKMLNQARVAMVSFAAANPIILMLTGLSLSIGYAINNFDQLKTGWHRTMADMKTAAADFVESMSGFFVAFRVFHGDSMEDAKKSVREWVKEMRIGAITSQIAADTISESQKKAAEDAATAEKRRQEALRRLNSSLLGADKKSKELLADLNKLYASGAISAERYYSIVGSTRQKMANKDFRDGKNDLFAYRDALLEIQRTELNRSFSSGAISAREYREEINSIEISKLNEQLAAGRINLYQFNQELSKIPNTLTVFQSIEVGVMQYLDSISAYSATIISATGSVMKSVEDEFVTFVKTGEATWQSFADNIIDQILRITYQMMIAKPIIESVMGLLSPAGYSIGGGGTMGQAPMLPNAKGNAFGKSGVIPFAKGGVVSQPTMFGFGGGRTGLMGEAGEEAIMPLQRMPNGDLGIQASTAPVIISVVNNATGAEISQTESRGANGERQIEIIVHNIVKGGLRTGKYDREMRDAYGSGRRGV